MAVTKFNGYQIRDGVLKNAHIADDAAIASSKLADGANFLKKDGTVSMTGNFNAGGYRIINVAEPTAGTDAATKNYVDSVSAGLDPKNSVRAATTGDITLANLQTVDTVSLADGDRVLVKNQDNKAENGIYIAKDGASWVRAGDFNSSANATGGAYVFVEEGSQHDTGWVCTTDGTIIIGTTLIEWSQFSGAGTYIEGNGIDITGNTISAVVEANKGLAVGSLGLSVVVEASKGLSVGANGLATVLEANKGLYAGTNGLGIITGNGIAVDSGGLKAVAEPSKGLSVGAGGIAVVLEANMGLYVGADGIGVNIEPSKGLTVGANGLATVIEANKGLTVGANGLATVIESAKGLTVGANGLAILVEANMGLTTTVNGLAVVAGNGLDTDANGIYVVPEANKGIAVGANGVSVVIEPSKGLTVGANGLATVLEANMGLYVGANGLGVDVNYGLENTADGINVKLDAGSGLAVGANGLKLNKVTREALSGTKDGSNKVFTMSSTPIAGTEHIYYNGQLLTVTDDYTIVGSTVTLTSEFEAPVSTDKLVASYDK